jgi:hypothetical protein
VWVHNCGSDVTANRAQGLEFESRTGMDAVKTGTRIGGQLRFPDKITDFAIEEAKCVKYQAWTSQLEDSASLAEGSGRTFILHVPESARLSGTVWAQQAAGRVSIVQWP